MEKKVDRKNKRILRFVLKKPCTQHLRKLWLYDHLPSIVKNLILDEQDILDITGESTMNS